MAWFEAYFERCRNQAKSGPGLKSKSLTQVDPNDPFWFLAKPVNCKPVNATWNTEEILKGNLCLSSG